MNPTRTCVDSNSQQDDLHDLLPFPLSNARPHDSYGSEGIGCFPSHPRNLSISACLKWLRNPEPLFSSLNPCDFLPTNSSGRSIAFEPKYQKYRETRANCPCSAEGGFFFGYLLKKSLPINTSSTLIAYTRVPFLPTLLSPIPPVPITQTSTPALKSPAANSMTFFQPVFLLYLQPQSVHVPP